MAAALVGYSATASLAIPGRRHPVIQAALGTGLAALTRAPLRLWWGAAPSGIRVGVAGAAAVTVGVWATTQIPAVRAGMLERDLPVPAWKWLTVDIPLGTVWSEEMLYRGALGAVAAGALGPGPGRLLQAAAFGLSHVVDARRTGEPVIGTVLATGMAGWLFGWLTARSGSVVAPMLVHLAVNEAGAVAAMAVQRRGPAADSCD